MKHPCEDCRRNCDEPCWKVEHGMLVEVVRCEDCVGWEKQADSRQGRCDIQVEVGIALAEKGKKMSMREYEEVKNIVIPKEQEEMMDIICDAWEECRASESCKNCPDRPQTYMRMMMCTALKYTRRLIEAGYAKRQASDGATVNNGRWNAINQIATGLPWKYRCSECGCPQEYTHNYCPNCGARMRNGSKTDTI